MANREKYFKELEHNLSWRAAPYLELLVHYRVTNPEKAEEICRIGLKKCEEEQTELIMYLLQRARETGDEKQFAFWMKSAKVRRRVDMKAVRAVFRD